MKIITDKERLDWMEEQFGCGLISDDNGHWAFSYSGFQNVVTGWPKDVETTFFVEAKDWKASIRAAIDKKIREDKASVSVGEKKS